MMFFRPPEGGREFSQISNFYLMSLYSYAAPTGPKNATILPHLFLDYIPVFRIYIIPMTVQRQRRWDLCITEHNSRPARFSPFRAFLPCRLPWCYTRIAGKSGTNKMAPRSGSIRSRRLAAWLWPGAAFCARTLNTLLLLGSFNRCAKVTGQIRKRRADFCLRWEHRGRGRERERKWE